MVIVDKDHIEHVCRIVITPNRSISWPRLVRIYIFTCFASFSIALLFTFFGFWIVLPFSGLEMLALGGALYLTNRKVFRQEVISSINGRVKIEKGCQYPEESWEFDKHWLQLNIQKAVDMHEKTRLYLGSHGKYVEVGSFLEESEKESLVFELNTCIISSVF